MRYSRICAVAKPQSRITPDQALASQCAFMERYVKRLVPIPFAAMHRRWDDIVVECEEEYPFRLIRAHRDSAKTTFWEIGYVLYRLCLWLWLRNQGQPSQDERIIMLGATDDAARASARQVRFELENNALIRQDFKPRMGKPWTDGAFSLAGAGDVKNPTVRAASLTGIKPGARATCVVAGDVVRPAHVFSKLQRDKDQQAWEEVVVPMIMDKGVAIINGTTFHSDDLLARLAKDSRYKVETFPLVLDEESKRVSWPERFSWSRVQELKKKPIVYSRQYQLVEMATSDRLIPMPEFFEAERLEKRDGRWRVDGEICRVVGAIDPAYTEREVNVGSRTVFVTGLLKPSTKELFIVDVRAVHYGPEKVKPLIDEVWHNWGHEAIWIEEVGLQKVFRLLLTRESAIPLMASKAQGDKVQRIVGTLSALMSNHKVKMLAEGLIPESTPEELAREIAEFPGEQMDCPDAMEHLIRNLYSSPAFAAGPDPNTIVRNVRGQVTKRPWIPRY